jgi:hypothetical protein
MWGYRHFPILTILAPTRNDNSRHSGVFGSINSFVYSFVGTGRKRGALGAPTLQISESEPSLHPGSCQWMPSSSAGLDPPYVDDPSQSKPGETFYSGLLGDGSVRFGSFASDQGCPSQVRSIPNFNRGVASPEL